MDDLDVFIERMGLYFDQHGLPATSGRILGFLLTCTPEVQSSGDIASALDTTSGSVSTNTRLLLTSGLIERVPVRGRRGAFFRVVPGAMKTLLQSKLESTMALKELMDEGLAAMGPASPEERARIEESRDFYAFFVEEFPKLMARWEARRGG